MVEVSDDSAGSSNETLLESDAQASDLIINRTINNITEPKVGIFAQLPQVLEEPKDWKLVADFSQVLHNGQSVNLDFWPFNTVEADVVQDEAPPTA